METIRWGFWRKRKKYNSTIPQNTRYIVIVVFLFFLLKFVKKKKKKKKKEEMIFFTSMKQTVNRKYH